MSPAAPETREPIAASRRLLVNGHRILVVEEGPGDGPVVVFVHGFPFSHRMWAPQFDALKDGYRLLAYDVRGLGQSEVGDGQYTMELFVDDLFGVMDGMGVDGVVACGLSMGGYILLRAVEREPQRFRGLVLCDTRSAPDTPEGKVARASSVRALKREGPGPFAEDFLPRVLSATTLEARPGIVDVVRDMVVRNRALGMAGAQIAMATRTDTSPVLETLDLPVLFVVGEHDGITPPDEMRRMAERVPDAELQVVPDAGHLSNLENPEAFNRALRTFLDELSRR